MTALLWESVKHYRAALRQGTASTKNRGLVSGAGKKLWKQKGTGRARIASIRSSALAWRRYGPRTEAAQLRVRVPAEEADGRAALGDCGEDRRRQAHGRRVVRRGRGEDQAVPHRAEQAGSGKTTLLVETSRKLDEKLYLGSRNLQGVELVLSSEVHPYDLLRYEHAIFSKDALEALQETLKKFVSKRASTRRRRLRNANPL